MYSEAHDSYDFTNHLLSFYADSAMRRKAAAAVMSDGPSRVLDIATGTGDTAIAIAKLAKEAGKATKITAIDVNEQMLKVARRKADAEGLNCVLFEKGDAMSLRYRNESFDAVVCTFATKNFSNIGKFLKETRRVLKRNGTFIVIDISKPSGSTGPAAFSVYLAYMKLFGLITGKKLYKWLPQSTLRFNREEFIAASRKCGFRNLKTEESLFGIAYMITCRK